MVERKLLQEFSRQIKQVPGVAWYKIGDIYGGQKRLDVFAVYKGQAFIFEFKRQGAPLDTEQLKQFKPFILAGAKCFIGWFYALPGGRHNRHVFFQDYTRAGLGCIKADCLWQDKKYTGLDTLFDLLS